MDLDSLTNDARACALYTEGPSSRIGAAFPVLIERLRAAEAERDEALRRALGHAYTSQMAEGGEDITHQELRREREDHRETRAELRAAEARVRELEAERDEHRESMKESHDAWCHVRAENAKLRESMKESHDAWCRVRTENAKLRAVAEAVREQTERETVAAIAKYVDKQIDVLNARVRKEEANAERDTWMIERCKNAAADFGMLADDLEKGAWKEGR